MTSLIDLLANTCLSESAQCVYRLLLGSAVSGCADLPVGIPARCSETSPGLMSVLVQHQ